MIKDLLTKKITRDILDKFLLKNSSEKLTLDLGCSGSPYSKYFKNRIGFDIKEGVGVDVVGDAHNLPFEDRKFDIGLCTEVLEHFHTPQLAISEMKRVLKSGGKLILTTRFIFPIHDAPHDYYRYTKYGLKHLFKDWEVLSLEEEVNTINTLSVLLQRIGYQTQLKMNSLSKVFIFLLSKIVTLFSFLIKKEYEDIERSVEESYIMTSGYYIVCKKK